MSVPALGDSFGLHNPAVLLELLGGTFLLYHVIVAVYNVFFHPLKHIPGPWWRAASPLPHARDLLTGSFHKGLKYCHDNYGEVVRIAPDEVSFISGETAWQDIYGFRSGKHAKNVGPYLKDRKWFAPGHNGVYSLIAADDQNHPRQRRMMSFAFSDRALREQEVVIQRYVDNLVEQLKTKGEHGQKALNLVDWYNFTTFDIIADLAFGDNLDCLLKPDYHWLVHIADKATQAIPKMLVKKMYPIVEWYERFFSSREAMQKSVGARIKFYGFCKDMVEKRLAQDTNRPDVWTNIIRNEGDKGMSKPEMFSNAGVLMIAGSETTASVLATATFLILKHPVEGQRLIRDIRQAFKSYDEISMDAVSRMPYLDAFIKECMRYHPAVPAGFPRIVPQGGDIISGHYVAAGTAVSVPQYTAYRSPRNFNDPDSFVPDRWLGDSPYSSDNKTVFQPFSFGARNCLGMNLANAELRLVLAKVLWSFDFEDEGSNDDFISSQKVWALWEKGPLTIRCKPVTRSV